jgi:polyisoprenoid-binding protein YceI
MNAEQMSGHASVIPRLSTASSKITRSRNKVPETNDGPNMLRRILLTTALFGAWSALAFADVSSNPQSAPKGSYEQNSDHTVVGFCTSHMDISTYCGRFDKTTAKLSFNGSQPDKSTLTATIDLTSVDTPSKELNDKLRKELFRNGPSATFTSTAVTVDGKNEGTITGNLTINGATKPVTLKVKFNGGEPFPFGDKYVLGFSATGSFKRSDFGLTDMVGAQFAGDVVTLDIAVEFLQLK